jgi:hypothetical protein
MAGIQEITINIDHNDKQLTTNSKLFYKPIRVIAN